MATREEIAWAAGLFEGEGCITMTANRLTLRVTNTDYLVLDRFDEIIALGTIYGPYRNSEADGCRRKPFWAWVASDAEALATLEILAPWLSDRRLARAYELTGLRFPVFTCCVLGAPDAD